MEGSVLDRVLERLNEHVKKNRKRLAEFWTSNRLCVTYEEFFKMLDAILFTISRTECQEIIKSGNEFIDLETIIKGVAKWLEEEKDVSQYLINQQKVIENNDQPQKTPIKTIVNGKYLRSHHTKKFQEEIKLNETLTRIKQESNYELTIRIGEINDICKRIKNNRSFLLGNANNGEHNNVIEINNKTHEEKEMTAKMFEKRYEQIKTEGNKYAEKIEGTLEEDLKKVIVEVMVRSEQLKAQIKLLEEKGISH